MARASQSALERAYYLHFAQHYPDAPEGEIAFSDKPDVLVKGIDLLGIEVANIYLRDGKDLSSEQVQSRLRSEVIRLAEALYLAAANSRFELWFDFDPSVPITNTQDLARRVHKCALQAIREKRECTSYRGFEDCPELRFMYYNGVEYADARWQPMQSHEIPTVDSKRVLEIIASKAAKAENYQQCDRYWLLLIVEFWDPAQDQHLVWDPSIQTGPTPFERIVIYKPATREWLELPQ